MKKSNCKICGDPISNRYTHRWFHTWEHDHWAVYPRNETKKCSECGDIVHFNDNKWWHIHDKRNGGICSIRDGTSKNIDYSQEEKMRNKKCYEMKAYIEYLGHNTNRYEEIEKYNGWLKWWQITPIKEIIKKKGDCDIWCTSIGTPQEEQKFKDNILYKQSSNLSTPIITTISLQNMEEKLVKINKIFDVLDEYLADNNVSEIKYLELVKKYKMESENLANQIIEKKLI